MFPAMATETHDSVRLAFTQMQSGVINLLSLREYKYEHKEVHMQ